MVSFVLVGGVHTSDAADPQDHLVLYLPFDEGGGDVTEDLSGAGLQAQLVGAYQWTTGVSGGAISFSATGRAEVSTSDPLNLTQITVMAWVRPASIVATVASNHWQNLNSIYGKAGSGGDDSVVLSLTGGDGVHFYVDQGANNNLVVPDAGVRTGEWQHVAGSFDGTVMRSFLDGTQIGEMAIQGVIISNAILPTIGGRADVSVDFDGAIDEVRVYNRALTPDEIMEALESEPGIAGNPSPPDTATDVPRNRVLGWNRGEFAETHNVYLGTLFGDVNDATVDDPGSVAVGLGLADTTFDPGRLEFDKTYYWRVDEVNGAPDFTVFPGDIWSFTTEPFSVSISNVTATASSSFGASVPENTINGSGLVDDLHGTSAADMWISAGIPATIDYAFDRAYKLHEMWVWNSNQTIESFIGFGAKDVVIEHSLDGENWTALEGVPELAQAPGLEGYAANNIIDFGGATAQHVRVSINTVQGFAPQASLSEVRFFSIPTLASRPSPDSGATNVAPDTTLSWGRNGREADRHEVYVGTNANDLALA
ncbi:MAG: LamG domain-containing protein, partial [Planctomycetes bacterium]|nr:LamG domain-containing protein [Planctomycetota bacterium]